MDGGDDDDDDENDSDFDCMDGDIELYESALEDVDELIYVRDLLEHINAND